MANAHFAATFIQANGMGKITLAMTLPPGFIFTELKSLPEMVRVNSMVTYDNR